MTPSESAAPLRRLSRSSRLPGKASAPALRRATAPASERVRPNTRCPAWMSSGTSAEPMNPVAPVTKIRINLSGLVCPKEGVDLAHGQWNPFLWLFPREHAHFSLWREHRGLHGDSVRMRRDIIRQNQHRCLAMAHEIARHGEDEVGVVAIHLSQIFFDHPHCDIGPALDEFRPPAGHIA